MKHETKYLNQQDELFWKKIQQKQIFQKQKQRIHEICWEAF